MSRHETLPAQLPHNIHPWTEAEIKSSSNGHPTYGETSHNPWPKGYHSLAQALGPIEEIMFQGSPGLNHKTTVSYLGPITRPSIPIVVGGKSSNQAMSVNSHAGGQPPTQITLPVSETLPSSGQVAAVAQPTVVIPPTNTNVVPPPSSSGKPLGVQPINNPSSWGYTYPGTQPPMTNQVYQQPPLATIYP